MRSLERVNIRTNVRTYVLTYIHTGQTLYPLHNFVVRGANNISVLPLFGKKTGVQLCDLNTRNYSKQNPHTNFPLLNGKQHTTYSYTPGRGGVVH